MGGIQLMTLKNLCVALTVACAFALSANSASAHLFGRGGSCGSWGGGSCGSWGGGSWGGGSWGGGSWGGGSCGSWGGYGSGGSWGGGSCGSCGGYGYSGGYYDGGYASSRVIYDGVVSSRSSSITVASAPAVKTSLTMHVPADAKVTLAGVDTKQTGETRQFATTRLPAGQSWDGYKVVVELNKNGQTLHEERTIKLVGGEAQELSVNFDSTTVAKN
jgi:uncharacterized protein (TIGR03000 family)